MATRRTVRSNSSWLSVLSYVAVMLLGLALTITFICKMTKLSAGNVPYYIERVALAIAIIVPVFLSYYEARRKTTVWFVLWVIATVLIVVFYILNWFF